MALTKLNFKGGVTCRYSKYVVFWFKQPEKHTYGFVHRYNSTDSHFKQIKSEDEKILAYGELTSW